MTKAALAMEGKGRRGVGDRGFFMHFPADGENISAGPRHMKRFAIVSDKVSMPWPHPKPYILFLSSPEGGRVIEQADRDIVLL